MCVGLPHGSCAASRIAPKIRELRNSTPRDRQQANSKCAFPRRGPIINALTRQFVGRIACS
jgi:hypothetical protein